MKLKYLKIIFLKWNVVYLLVRMRYNIGLWERRGHIARIEYTSLQLITLGLTWSRWWDAHTADRTQIWWPPPPAFWPPCVVIVCAPRPNHYRTGHHRGSCFCRLENRKMRPMLSDYRYYLILSTTLETGYTKKMPCAGYRIWPDDWNITTNR